MKFFRTLVTICVLSVSPIAVLAVDEKPVASATEAPARVRAAAAWETLRTTPQIDGKSTSVPAVAFGKESGLLATANNSGTVIAIDPTTGEEVWRTKVDGASDMLDISRADVLCIASGSHDFPGQLTLLNWNTGEYVGRVGPYEGSRNGVSLHEDKGLLAWIAADDVVIVIDLRTSQMTQYQVEHHTEPINAIAFDAAGEKIFTAGADHRAVVLTLSGTGSSEEIFKGAAPLMDVAVDPANSTLVAVASTNGRIHLINTEDSGGAPVEMKTSERYVANVCFSNLNPRVLIATAGGSVDFFDTETGILLNRIQLDSKALFGFDASSEGRLAAIGHFDGTVSILKSAATTVLAEEAISNQIHNSGN